MSKTLHIACDSCKKSLWVGQLSNSRGWYLYTGESETMDALNKFINDHISHDLKFDDSEEFFLSHDDITKYRED